MNWKEWVIIGVVVVIVLLGILSFWLPCGVVIRSEWKEFPRNETECLLYQEPQPDKFKWENKTCWMYTEQWIC